MWSGMRDDPDAIIVKLVKITFTINVTLLTVKSFENIEGHAFVTARTSRKATWLWNTVMRQLYIFNFWGKVFCHVTSFTKYRITLKSPHEETKTHASFSLLEITSHFKKIIHNSGKKAESDKHTCYIPFTHTSLLIKPSAFLDSLFFFSNSFKYIFACD